MSELVEVLTSLSAEVAALSERIQKLDAHDSEVTTGLNLLNTSIERVAAEMRTLHSDNTELRTSIRYLRRDVEQILKHGCTMRCPPPDGDEPDTAPSMPPLRAVSAQHD